ncbi:hypothetical protein CAPTEDRAFT_149113 [Capitella teleta]|uniref:Alkaline phosphatase n=1 Tax=Capitella teleta TaxID=283909 RepID=X1Z5E2_CAPTE|nr:hypothetical protein CAPTEDRAFT_149113 [Capitella teleta]|eukprot:ELU10153.1 hypothetical protein CAPTEDRAFT_149113 [Capitella teleta]
MFSCVSTVFRMRSIAVANVVLVCFVVLSSAFEVPDEDWNKIGADTLEKLLNIKENSNKARNVILFLGDGMGIPTITAGRIYKGQKEGNPGEETVLNFEAFPHTALAKTYNVNHQVPDSAGTGTAYLCGVKANYATLGVTHKVEKDDCDASLEDKNRVSSIAEWFNKDGRSTGIITTARLTHATPAAVYAKSSSRYWESDKDLEASNEGKCKDIAAQLIEDNGYIQVLMGGGRRNYWPKNKVDPQYPTKNGTRVDNRDLMKVWRDMREEEGVTHADFYDKAGFDQVDPEKIDYMLGLFDYSHMQYELDRVKQTPINQPSLKEMTEKAIKILNRNDKGYFLLVEAGRIDHAHHDALPKKALEDTVALDEAVKQALSMTDTEDTLIVVTADHSHVFTQGGYPARGRNILGFVGPESEVIEPTRDGFPTPILNYAQGPVVGRYDLSDVDMEADDFTSPALIKMDYETHGGEDVAVYAQGPHSHLFKGTIEQNVIAHVMGYSACVGDHIQRGGHCSPTTAAPTQANAAPLSASGLFVPTMTAILVLVTINMS